MKIGDTVRFLNSIGGGRVVRLDGQLAYVEDEDGFEVPVLQRECVIVASAADDARMAASVDTPAKASLSSSSSAALRGVAPKAAPAPAAAPVQAPIPVEEVEGADKLNITLAFAASDLKRLSDQSTTYDAFIVNDSNYYLSYALAARGDDSKEWTLLAQGEIEPNIQEFVAEITRDILPAMDRIALQYVAFKRARTFELKHPGEIEQHLDTTKFFKLHCFRPSDYFDEPVIEMALVTDDCMAGHPIKPDPEVLRRNLMEKKRIDNRKPRPIGHRSAPKAAPGEPLVTDLHISELVDSTRGLSNADMLNLQIDCFREVMDANLSQHGRKLIFIHGKGEGVLRAAIMKELNHRYKGHDVQDASFREYGFGATQVTIR